MAGKKKSPGDALTGSVLIAVSCLEINLFRAHGINQI
jgi:hypothetical protein